MPDQGGDDHFLLTKRPVEREHIVDTDTATPTEHPNARGTGGNCQFVLNKNIYIDIADGRENVNPTEV